VSSTGETPAPLLSENRAWSFSSAPGEVDRAAQTIARQQSHRADVVLVCVDASLRLPIALADGVSPPDATDSRTAPQRLIVLTKIDLVSDLPAWTDVVGSAVATSSVTGEGIEPLKAAIRDAALAARTSGADVVAGTAVRCGHSLRLAAESLGRARAIVRADCAEELIAAEVRVALDELGKVVGTVYTDDVLERVFSRFCIGK
jgi:tRNA modification GTPase